MLALLPTQPDLSVTPALQQVIRGPPSLNPLLDCSATSQVRVSSIQTERDHYWMLESLDENGQRKTIGGDEFYVSFMDAAYTKNSSDGSSHPTAMAFVRDQCDGTYRLGFVTSPFNYNPNKAPMGHGLLILAFQYTCGIGSMTNHSKSSWKHGGTSGSSPTLRLLNAKPHRCASSSLPPHLLSTIFPMYMLLGTRPCVNLSARSGIVAESHIVIIIIPIYTIVPSNSTLSFILERPCGIEKGAFSGKKLTNDASTALIVGVGAWDLIKNPYPLIGRCLIWYKAIVTAVREWHLTKFQTKFIHYSS